MQNRTNIQPIDKHTKIILLVDNSDVTNKMICQVLPTANRAIDNSHIVILKGLMIF